MGPVTGVTKDATMYAELIPLATALMLGSLHALEIDHMVAVTTFVSRRPTLASAARFGFRWGLGHSIAVLVVGSLLLVSGVRWPSQYDAIGEAIVGVMLILLGARTIVFVRKLHLHTAEEHGDHGHLHLHAEGSEPHHHHHHRHHREHDTTNARHSHGGITLVGLMHGLAGTTGVIALMPVTLMGRTSLGFGYLTSFGVGVTAAMTLFAVVAAIAMRRTNQRSLEWGRRVTLAVGICGMVVGAWWVWGALAA